jgi:hypothetical protein
MDELEDLDVDPGWSLSIGTDKLAALRVIWLAFSGALLLFGIAVIQTVPEGTGSSTGGWLLGLALAVVASFGGQSGFGGRPLSCDDAASLVRSFQTRFFITTAFAEAPCLLAFVATFVTGQWWIYWVVLPFGLLGFWRNAPTSTHLQTEQERLRDRGCNLSLIRALRTATPAAR